MHLTRAVTIAVMAAAVLGACSTPAPAPSTPLATSSAPSATPSTQGPTQASTTTGAEPQQTTPVVESQGETDDVGDIAPAANPVPLVKKIKGCTVPEGMTQGETRDTGDRVAECQFLKEGGIVSASVTLTTFIDGTDPTSVEPALGEPPVPSDIETYIVGKNFVAHVVDTTMTTAKPDRIAKQLGGKVYR